MSNWNFNGTLEENGKRVITKGAGIVNMVGAREEASVSFANDDGKMVMTLNIPTGGGSGGGSSESGVGKFWKDDNGNNLGEYFNNYTQIETKPYGSGIIANEGYGNEASGLYSHAEGNGTLATGLGAHAEGSKRLTTSSCYYPTTATGVGSHAEGCSTEALGEGSHAEGIYSKASGCASHAEGHSTEAKGDQSHAEGYNTTASGDYSHAEGSNTEATGSRSHAEGGSTIASSDYSHAEGYHTVASSEYQHVQGKYNVEDSSGKYADIIGGGTSYYDRKNISALDWDGNLTIAGDLYVGNTSTPLIKCLTQAEFDAITTKNPKTLYLIKEE